MLNFRVLFIDDPFLSVDFFEQKSDLSLMLFFQAGCTFDMNVAIFLLDVFDLGFVHFFEFKNSFSQRVVFSDEVFDFAFISILEISVFLKLRFELSVSVGIGSFKLGDLIFQNGDLRGVILFEGFDFNELFSAFLFFSILKFSFHIVGSSGHEILEFVFFLFELYL